jgi:hypothetical protein
MINLIFLIFVLNIGQAFSESFDSQGSEDVDVINNTVIQDVPEGHELLWSDEFNIDGKPDEKYWIYEEGFVRNEELQWYKKENASIKDGLLYLEGKREIVPNDRYKDGMEGKQGKCRIYICLHQDKGQVLIPVRYPGSTCQN